MSNKFIGDDAEELRRVQENSSFHQWQVWLHPTQQQFVDRNYSGAGKVSGGAGTGKTVVLIHRTNRLLDEASPAPAILLTTFTRSLAESLKEQMSIMNPDYLEAGKPGDPGLWIAGIDSVVNHVLTEIATLDENRAAVARVLGSEGIIRSGTISGPDAAERWRTALLVDDGGLKPEIANPSFLNDEFELVVLANGITTLAEYRKAARPGRGTPLNRGERARVWKVIESFRRSCLMDKRLTFAGRAAVAAEIIAASGKPLFAHTLIDEAQDFHAGHWRFLRAATAAGENDIFLAEDSHQRIYGKPVVLSRFGISTRGAATRKLTRNYRTTRENLGYALQVLQGAEWVDSFDEVDSEEFQRSSTSGPEPRVLNCPTVEAELEEIARAITQWQDAAAQSGREMPTIGVLARTRRAVDRAIAGLNELGIVASDGKGARPAKTSAGGGGVRVLTMHNAKGMEFNHVVLFDVDKKSLPLSYITDELGEADAEAAVQRERALLYVAASRAREELVITTGPEPSELLPARASDDAEH